MPQTLSGTPAGAPYNILLIRPSALGDVCRTVPILASLHAAYPDARIDWLVQDTFVDAVRAHPALHRVIPFPRRDVAVSKWLTRDARRTLRAFLGDLRDGGYDLVLDCQGLGRSGFFAWWTRARYRVGYADAGEFAWLGVNQRVHAPRSTHTVDRMLALVGALGVPVERDMRLYSPDDTEPVAGVFGNGAYIVVAPTSRWPGKRWADERYAALITALLKNQPEYRFVIVGGGLEREQCRAVLDIARTNDRVIDAVGKTSIAQLMHTIEHCALLVANDSAALHMAVGFDRPAVALFGPTRTELVGPYRRDTDVIQHAPPGSQNQHKDETVGVKLMDSITVDEVLGACMDRLVHP